MIVSTNAIVLRSMKYGDTSKIVTVYSRKYGKMKVIAKGARSSKNKFGASLEPMTHSSMILYRKEHRDLHLLSKAEIAEPLFRLGNESDKLAVDLAIVELVNMVMHDEEENQAMFALLAESLEVANNASQHVLNVLFAFEVRMCELFGYGLDVASCSVCGRNICDDAGIERAFFMLASGSVMCDECRSRLNAGGMKVSKDTVRSLLHFRSDSMSSVPELALGPQAQDDILSLLSLYVKYHIQGVRTLKSLSLFTNT